MNETTQVPLDNIDPNPWQVRLTDDPEAVAKLAASIAEVSLLQPPAARKVDGRYQLAFGHTRYAAYVLLRTQAADKDQQAKWAQMPLVIRELTDRQMFEMAVTENVKRKNLSPIEEAQAMQRALTDFGYNSGQVGDLFGVAPETVRGIVRLLKLPEPLQEKVAGGSMTVRAARQFLTVQRIDPKGAKKAAVEIAKLEDAGLEPVDRELDEVLRRSNTVVNMWRDARGEARGGNGLWPLSWNVKPEQLDPFTEKDLKTLSKEHLANPPKCLECPLYSRLQDEHYCGSIACWSRKAAAWLRLEITKISKQLEIPIYDPKKDGKQIQGYTSTYDEWSTGFRAALTNKKSPARAGLRLIVYTDEERNNYYQHFPGTDHERIMIIDVAGAVKKQKRSSYSGASGRDTGYQRRHLAIKRSEDFVKGVAAPALGPAFAGLKSLPVLEAMTGFGSRRDIYSDATDKARKEYKTMGEAAKRKYLQTELARQLIMERRSVLEYRSAYSNTVWSKGPVALANALRPVAKQWGVQLPPDWLKQAKAMMPKPERKSKKGKRK